MAAPPDKSAVEAYSLTKVRGAKPSVPAKDWAPTASADVKAKAAELHKKAGVDARAAVSAHDPLRPTGAFAAAGELPADTLPKGGRKSRRRRRGGARPGLELMADLARDPSRATLENVIADLKTNPQQAVVQGAEAAEQLLLAPLAPGETEAQRVGRVIELLQMTLVMAGGKRRHKTRRRGGAMIKPVGELIADLERDPSKATLENVLSDLTAADHQMLRDIGRTFEHELRVRPLRAGENMHDRVQTIIGHVKMMLRRYGAGGRRGGAMTKPLRELIADLERDPTKATLENVISDLKASDNRVLVGYGEGTEIRLRMRLRPGETMEQHVRATIDGLLPLLRGVRGGRRKTTRRR